MRRVSRRWLLKVETSLPWDLARFSPPLLHDSGYRGWFQFSITFPVTEASHPEAGCKSFVPSTIISPHLPPVSNCRLAGYLVPRLVTRLDDGLVIHTYRCLLCRIYSKMFSILFFRVLRTIFFSIIERRNWIYLLCLGFFLIYTLYK